MTPCVITLGDKSLYCDLSASLINELLADIISRYEGLFMMSDPIYPNGKADLLFRVLHEGYGLQPCDASIGVETVDLRTADVKANSQPNQQWKDIFAGRVMAQIFASTLSCS